VLSWLVLLLSYNTPEASGAYAKIDGVIERLFKGRDVEERVYCPKKSVRDRCGNLFFHV
jgi:hypothetical protein